jgi:hypothetical protein
MEPVKSESTDLIIGQLLKEILIYMSVAPFRTNPLQLFILKDKN